MSDPREDIKKELKELIKLGYEMLSPCTSSEHLRQNKHFTKRVFSGPIYPGVYTLSRCA